MFIEFVSTIILTSLVSLFMLVTLPNLIILPVVTVENPLLATVDKGE